MGIPIEKYFVVKAAPREVWAFLTDPSRVAACLPGAAITGQVDERTHAGTITVKVGPVSARYKGTVRFERLDREEGVAEIVAAGQDMRGKGGADMRMTSRVVERGPAETEVTVASTVNVTGILAQFGRGLIQDLSDQMFGQFTAAMRAALESAPGPVAVDGPGAEPVGAESPVGGERAGAEDPSGSEPGADIPAGADTPGTGRPAPDPPEASRPSADSAGAQAFPASGDAGGTRVDAAGGGPGAQAPPAGAATGGDATGNDAIDAVSLGAGVARRALGRAARRPGFWLTAFIVVAAIFWLLYWRLS